MAFPSITKTPVSEQIQSVSFANASLPIDRNLGLIIQVAPLTGNLTLATPINMVAGDVIKYYFVQDAIGGRTVTFPGALSFGAGTANQKFVVAFDYDGTNFTEVLTDGGLTGFGIPSIAELTNSATLDFPSIPSQTSSDLVISAPIGFTLTVGKPVKLGIPSNTPTGVLYNSFVSSDGSSVTVRAFNITSSTVDPVSGVFSYSV